MVRAVGKLLEPGSGFGRRPQSDGCLKGSARKRVPPAAVWAENRAVGTMWE